MVSYRTGIHKAVFERISASNMEHKVICCDDHFTTTGISGHGSFTGNIEELLPFLMLGTYVHAGKNAAFGMGAYELKIS